MTDQLPSLTVFRRYDIRGIVGSTLTPEIVGNIGRAYASRLRELRQSQVIVARDARLSSPGFARAFIEALLASGIDVIDLGAAPTPVAYFATHELNIPNAAIITGSHNPSDYNGLKLTARGRPLHSEKLRELYERIRASRYVDGEGRLTELDIIPRYLRRIVGEIQLARPLRIVVDGGNGVAGATATELFRQLGCDATPIYCEPDGHFPNHHPNPSDPANLDSLIERVRSGGFDLGLAFDGDGDRLGVVDSSGEIIWPDRLMMLFSRNILQRHPGGRIVFDVKSSRHLEAEVARSGGEPVMWASGYSLIRQKISEVDAIFGGELSGHLFFRDRWYGFDDGLYAGARLLEILASESRDSHAVFADLPNGVNTPEIMVAFESESRLRAFMEALMSGKNGFGSARVQRIDGLRVDYDDGWGLARESHTTPSLSLRFEGETDSALQRIQADFKRRLLAVEQNLKLPF